MKELLKPRVKKSSSSVAGTRKTKPTGSSSLTKAGRKKPKKPHAVFVKSWNSRRAFVRYLDSLKSAKRFLTEGGVYFLYISLNTTRRTQIMRRIKEVDPEGHAAIVRLRRKVNSNKRLAKKLVKEKVLKEQDTATEVALAQNVWECEGITKFRFVPADTVLDLIAMLLAAGYTIKEVHEQLEVDLALIKRVTPEMVAAQKKNFHEAIVVAADKKVLHDLVTGEVTDTTDRADRIAGRRRKLYLDAAKESRESKDSTARRALPVFDESKEKKVADRFGVKRKSIDVPSKEKPNEDNASGSTAKD